MASITPLRAEQIVRDCIRSAVGFTGLIRSTHKLSEVGIQVSANSRALVDEIVTNRRDGVPGVGCRIDPRDLDCSSSKKVFEVADQIADNASCT